MVALEPLVERGWLAAPALPAAASPRTRVDFGRVLPWREQQLRGRARLLRARHRQTTAPRSPPGAERRPAGSTTTRCSWRSARRSMASPGGNGRRRWPAATPAALDAARSEYADEIALLAFRAMVLRRPVRGAQATTPTQRGMCRSWATCRSSSPTTAPTAGRARTCTASTTISSHGGRRRAARRHRPRSASAGAIRCIAGTAWRPRTSPGGRRACGARWTQADVVRIDHFRGFAGYWEIPASCPTADEGRWVPGPGKALFDAPSSTAELGKLPIVAEDLGLITPDVIELRDGCGFPGMRILQFAFGGDGSARIPAAQLRAQHRGLHRHPRQRHRARLVGPRAPTPNAHFAGSLPGCGRGGCPLGA